MTSTMSWERDEVKREKVSEDRGHQVQGRRDEIVDVESYLI